ncbi:MAG: YqgE/AlgH family protein [Ignavibacteria bacterium]|jgi:putative transcriptional regulator
MANEEPAKGKILISEPFLNDPNFKRTIILLSEHGEEGSIGFILNKPTQFKMSQLVDDFPEFDAPVFYGGPVQVNTLQFIHRAGDIIEDSTEILPGLFWGGSFEILRLLIESKQVKPEDFIFFIGYSGWSEGQLEDELKINSWIVTSASAENIFSDEPDKLWTETLKKMGKKFAILASFPENPSVN